MQVTMKNIKGFAAATALVALMAGCQTSIDDLAQERLDNKSNTETKTLTAFAPLKSATTRTSMSYPDGDFFWENADKIYVLDDNNTYQASNNMVTADKQASFKFMVPGSFAKSNTYTVFYPGKNKTNNNVTIADTQNQAEPNSTKHFGEAGDCGMAVATKNGGQFEFKLDHKVAYLCFLPRTSQQFTTTYISKIEVTSDNNLAGDFTLNPDTKQLDGYGSKNTITLNLGGGVGRPNGFKLDNSTAKVDQNGAFIVIKPGAHKLIVRYHLIDTVTKVKGVVTSVVKSKNYIANQFYDISPDITVRNFNSQLYYTWDAKQDYWYGQTTQPKDNGLSGANYPAASDVDRWYNKIKGSGPLNATNKAKDCPNANECKWYAMKGDPHWDESTLWTIWGHLRTGGLWLKKQSVIASENSISQANLKNGYRLDNGKMYDYTNQYTDGGDANKTIAKGRPGTNVLKDYFFLPALGCYINGTLSGLGTNGFFWTKSASAYLSQQAFYLYFNSREVRLGNGGVEPESRKMGQALWKVDGPNQ